MPGLNAARRDRLVTLIIVGALAAIAIARPLARRLAAHPSPERCRELLDRYTNLVAEQATPPEAFAKGEKHPPPPKPVAANDPEIARCARTLTLAEADCAAQATNPDAFERCVP